MSLLATIELPARRSSVGRARAFVAEMLELWDLDDPNQVSVLLTSELVTNAVRHAAKVVSFGVCLEGATLRVEASDDDPDFPVVFPISMQRENGRGMFLIHLLAERWGIRPCAPPTKTVWFEIAVIPRGR